MLESLDEEVRRAWLVRCYYTRQGSPHGKCFYNELCDPLAACPRNNVRNEKRRQQSPLFRLLLY